MVGFYPVDAGTAAEVQPVRVTLLSLDHLAAVLHNAPGKDHGDPDTATRTAAINSPQNAGSEGVMGGFWTRGSDRRLFDRERRAKPKRTYKDRVLSPQVAPRPGQYPLDDPLRPVETALRRCQEPEPETDLVHAPLAVGCEGVGCVGLVLA